MNLAFSKYFPPVKKTIGGIETRFTERIWAGLVHFNLVSYADFELWTERLFQDENIDFDYLNELIHNQDYKGKVHTIRRDKLDKWSDLETIHLTLLNKFSKRYKIAPGIKCQGKQAIEFKYYEDENGKVCKVSIESVPFGCVIWNNGFEHEPIITGHLQELAENDGFNNVDELFSYFDQDFKGYLIHWTPYKYKDWNIIK